MTLKAQTFHSLQFCHGTLDSENNFTVALCLKEIVSRDLLVVLFVSVYLVHISH
jgi:hypothetical protein